MMIISALSILLEVLAAPVFQHRGGFSCYTLLIISALLSA